MTVTKPGAVQLLPGIPWLRGYALVPLLYKEDLIYGVYGLHWICPDLLQILLSRIAESRGGGLQIAGNALRVALDSIYCLRSRGFLCIIVYMALLQYGDHFICQAIQPGQAPGRGDIGPARAMEPSEFSFYPYLSPGGNCSNPSKTCRDWQRGNHVLSHFLLSTNEDLFNRLTQAWEPLPCRIASPRPFLAWFLWIAPAAAPLVPGGEGCSRRTSLQLLHPLRQSAAQKVQGGRRPRVCPASLVHKRCLVPTSRSAGIKRGVCGQQSASQPAELGHRALSAWQFFTAL